MRIQHNIMAMNANRNLTMNNTALSKNLEKLSSGYRINRAGDDAAGLAISEKMRAQIAVLGQAQNNANDGISLVQTAEGAMTEIHDMLDRAIELLTQHQNGTYSTTDKNNIGLELTELSNEISRITSSAKFNGQSLFNTSFNICVGSGGSDTITISVSNISASVSTSSTITAVETLVDNVSTARANLGAMQNRLEHTVNNLGVMEENLQNAESTIRDTNIADEMMAYTKNNILIQSAQAMLAQANQVPQGVLQLMQ